MSAMKFARSIYTSDGDKITFELRNHKGPYTPLFPPLFLLLTPYPDAIDG